ncbi:MAG TPA: TauD/TfdA family dioxygenase [Candidatus Binataceae bacterium]|nr:TauD/TfdA family dioxygenase [Candidatus Binataceae bacterium]
MTDTGVESALKILPIAGNIGAEIGGLRLSGDLTPSVVRLVREALLKYKVIFFRGQEHLDEVGHEAFASLMGDPEPHPTLPPLEGSRAVLSIDHSYGDRTTAWHTDLTFLDAYPQASILRALVVPSYGGDTIWANTAVAYSSLPPKLQEFADNLWAVHTNVHEFSALTRTDKREDVRRNFELFTSSVYETEHPVVRIHPESGERCLVLGGFVREFVGLPVSDSRQLFQLFQEYVTRVENTVRWRWAKGDVAVWDNRATQHAKVNDSGPEQRLLHRVSVAGDVPVSISGRRSQMRKTER